MRFFPVLVSLLLLSACNTVTTSEALREYVPRLAGKNIDYVIKYLGYPDATFNVEGKKVYVWGTDVSTSVPMTTYNPQVTTSYTPYGAISSYSSVPSVTAIPMRSHCKIQVATIKGKIVDANADGNMMGCTDYCRKLEPFIDEKIADDEKKEALKEKNAKKEDKE